MNSGSEKKLSMDELMALNQPVQTAQSTPQPTAQEPTPPPEAYPTKEEWEDLVEYLYTLGYHAERQAGHQKKISESLATRAQMDELLKAVKRLEEMAEQAGKKKEKRFSIPSIRLPKLHLPESDWPTVVTILMALAVLFLMWWAWGGDWSSLSLLDL